MALSLSMTRGKTALFQLTVTQEDGITPFDLTGYSLFFHALVAGLAVDKDSVMSGITVIDAAGGLAELKVDPADTEDLPEATTNAIQVGSCELVCKNDDDETEVYELDRGTLIVYSNVGTP